MKKHYVAVLFTLICVLGLALGARAEDDNAVIAKVPYDFVVGGQVMPAGTYRVSRVHPETGSRELEISSYETGAGALLIATVFDSAQTKHTQLKFEHVGDKYFLSSVETPIGTYAVAIRPSAIKLALQEQQSASSSGSN